MSSFELDSVSRATIGRFAWKCYIALAIGMFSKAGYLTTASKCLFLYAFIMALVAAFTRQRYVADSFNHWSEALWLSFFAAGLHLLA